jgi:hypothetical protein
VIDVELLLKSTPLAWHWSRHGIAFVDPNIPPSSLLRGEPLTLSLSIYIHMEMDSATDSNGLGDPRVDRHLIIRNTHPIFPSSLSYALLPSFVDPRNLSGSTWPRNPPYPLALFPCSWSQKRSFLSIPIGYHVRCSEVLMIGCRPTRSTISPHRDRVNFEMHCSKVIEGVWRYT